MQKRTLQISVPVLFLMQCGAASDPDGQHISSSISEMNMVKHTMIQYAQQGWKIPKMPDATTLSGVFSHSTEKVHFTFHEHPYTDWLFSLPPRERRPHFFLDFMKGYLAASVPVSLPSTIQTPSDNRTYPAPDIPVTATPHPQAVPAVASTKSRLDSTKRDPFRDLASGFDRSAKPS